MVRAACQTINMNEQKFWDSSMPITETGCWIWMKATTNFGYGIFKGKRAHRISWELTNGPIPIGISVCHKCDIPACINPSHLFLGTHKENMADMRNKDRAERGERHHASKLNAEQAKEIIEARKIGVTLESLSVKYGVNKTTISKIANGHRWKKDTGIETIQHVRGERWTPLKLSVETLKEIRIELNNGCSQQKLADKYGIHQSTISRALRREGI